MIKASGVQVIKISKDLGAVGLMGLRVYMPTPRPDVRGFGLDREFITYFYYFIYSRLQILKS